MWNKLSLTLTFTLTMLATTLLTAASEKKTKEKEATPVFRDKSTVETSLTSDSVAFSPDGKCIAIGLKDGFFELRQTATGNLLKTFRHLEKHLRPASAVTSVSRFVFSRDGKMLASACGNSPVTLWDMTRLKKIKTLPVRSVGYDLTLSGDGSLLVGIGVDTIAGPQRLTLWNTTSGKSIKSITVKLGRGADYKQNLIRRAHFTKSGGVLAIETIEDGIGYFRLWNTKTGKETVKTKAEDWWFAPDGKVAVTRVSELRQSVHHYTIWDANTGQMIKKLPAIRTEDGTEENDHLVFSPDGKFVAMGLGCGAFELRDAATWKVLKSLKLKDVMIPALMASGATTLAFSRDGKVLATAGGHTPFALWNVMRLEKIADISNRANFDSLTFSKDGTLIVGIGASAIPGAHRISLWNTTSGKLIKSLKVERKGEPDNKQDLIRRASFTKSGGILAIETIEDGIVFARLWETKTGEEIVKIQAEAWWLSPDGKYLVTKIPDDKTGRNHHHTIWDATSGKIIKKITTKTGSKTGTLPNH